MWISIKVQITLKQNSPLLAFVTQDSIYTTNIHYMSSLTFKILVETHTLANRKNITKRSEENLYDPWQNFAQITESIVEQKMLLSGNGIALAHSLGSNDSYPVRTEFWNLWAAVPKSQGTPTPTNRNHNIGKTANILSRQQRTFLAV